MSRPKLTEIEGMDRLLLEDKLFLELKPILQMGLDLFTALDALGLTPEEQLEFIQDAGYRALTEAVKDNKTLFFITKDCIKK